MLNDEPPVSGLLEVAGCVTVMEGEGAPPVMLNVSESSIIDVPDTTHALVVVLYRPTLKKENIQALI